MHIEEDNFFIVDLTLLQNEVKNIQKVINSRLAMKKNQRETCRKYFLWSKTTLFLWIFVLMYIFGGELWKIKQLN